MKVLILTIPLFFTLTTFSLANTCKTTSDCPADMRCCYSEPLPAFLENPKDHEGFCTYDINGCHAVK